MGQHIPDYPPQVAGYVERLFNEDARLHACRASNPSELAEWKRRALPEYLRILGIPRIAEMAGSHTPTCVLDPAAEDMGAYTRRRGTLDTEPDVSMAFWLLLPKDGGRLPLAVMPQGHGTAESYVGITHSPGEAAKAREEDRDVAVQAVNRGYAVLVPSTRGIGANPTSFRIPDTAERHHGVDCVCHNWHAIAAGRTLIGERVWDMMRLIDWAVAELDIDTGRILMLGNSGGGMATVHTAAADERITVAVPCGAFTNYVSFKGTLRHCPCNLAPGILRFGELWDVAGLTAPRYQLTVNGRYDHLHAEAEVANAASRLERIYRAAGAPERYEHRFGEGGHRFFKDLMWPWIDRVMSR